MSARIDTNRTLTEESIDIIVDKLQLRDVGCIDYHDSEVYESFVDDLELITEATLVKPEANSLERYVIDYINESVETGYMLNGCTDGMDALKSVIRDILKDVTCIMTYHTDTYQFYVDHRFAIEELLDESEAIPKDKLDESFQHFYDYVSWTAFEITVTNLMAECNVDY